MGSMTLLLGAFVFITYISYSEAAGTCPMPSKVYGCSPKCKEDYECTQGKVCCSNACNAKSCSEPAAYGGGTGSSHKHATGGTGVYCENVKCSAYEICKRDPLTKRMKCSRA